VFLVTRFVENRVAYDDPTSDRSIRAVDHEISADISRRCTLLHSVVIIRRVYALVPVIRFRPVAQLGGGVSKSYNQIISPTCAGI